MYKLSEFHEKPVKRVQALTGLDIYPVSRKTKFNQNNNFKIKSRGRHNLTYVVCRYPAKLVGRYEVDASMSHDEAENWFEATFDNIVQAYPRNSNRNIDFYRKIGSDYQKIEVKLSSGFYETPPQIVRSSTKQFDALLADYYITRSGLQKTATFPSLYLIISNDLVHAENNLKKYINTVWAIPVSDSSKFSRFATDQSRKTTGARYSTPKKGQRLF